MHLDKKDKIIIVLSFSLILPTYTGVICIFISDDLACPLCLFPDIQTLTIGMENSLPRNEPTDCWDRTSRNVIEQVVETLFIYDKRVYKINGTMPRINWLASDYQLDMTNTILTVNLREGVYFHDGTLMDANAVAWSFNRMLYLMNHTGELPSSYRASYVHSLYEFPEGMPIFQSIEAIDTYEVKFTLNAPYSPILDLLCYISSGILSPDSTPATRRVSLMEKIIGTGPYRYDKYIADSVSVGIMRFSKSRNYWATHWTTSFEEEVMFDKMVFIIDNPTRINYGMLMGEIDILFDPINELLPMYKEIPTINVYESSNPSLSYQYLSFNTNQINVTWRKAMSYAINYSYIIEMMMDGRAYRSYGPISSAFGESYNTDLPNIAANYNLKVARQTILDALSGDPRLDPRLQANDTLDDPTWLNADLATFNYSYILDDSFMSSLYPLLRDWFDDIGITVLNGSSSWWYFAIRVSDYIPGGYDQLQLYTIIWDPEYLDPYNMLEPLFSNVSASNGCQINDPLIMTWLYNALSEMNNTIRNEIYHNIQSRVAGILYPHAFLYHPSITVIHSADIYDIAYNSMDIFWALPVKKNLIWLNSF